MASAYPGGLDSFATNKADGTATPTDHPTHHNNLADAVNKIEAELGTNPSGAAATVAAAIAAASVPEGLMYPYGYVTGETPHASDDFFTSYSGYTEVTPSGTPNWAATRGGLTARFMNVGNGNIAATVKAVPVAGVPITIETCMTIVSREGNNHGAGILFTNGTGTGATCAGFGLMTTSGGGTGWSTPDSTLNGAGSGLNGAGQIAYGMTPTDVYMRWVWSAANTFEFAVSPDGEAWTDFGASTFSRTFTPTHMGFYVTNWNGSSIQAAVAFKYLRVYEADLSV